MEASEIESDFWVLQTHAVTRPATNFHLTREIIRSSVTVGVEPTSLLRHSFSRRIAFPFAKELNPARFLSVGTVGIEPTSARLQRAAKPPQLRALFLFLSFLFGTNFDTYGILGSREPAIVSANFFNSSISHFKHRINFPSLLINF